MSDHDAAHPHRLRIFIRDHRLLEASARIPDGHRLAAWLASRDRYLSLTDVLWVGTKQRIPHMALKVGTILWAASADAESADAESASPGADPARDARRVELELEGGYVIAAGLPIARDQRLTDFLESAPPFVSLRAALLRPRNRELGDVAVSHDAIQLVREIPGSGRAAGAPRHQAPIEAPAVAERVAEG